MLLTESLVAGILSLAMLAGFCLILRKPLLWYFKLDKYLENQQRIIALLEQHREKKSRPDERNRQKQNTGLEQANKGKEA